MEQEIVFSTLFHHCTKVVNHNGIYYPQRFSDSMLKFYGDIDEGKEIRARSTAGITMECVTDASEVSFSYTSKAFCRDIVAFDVFENDVFMQTITEPEHSLSGRICYKKRTPGPVKLTIFLPQCVHVGIGDISLGQWQPTAAPHDRMLFLGDSITQGMTVSSPSQAFPVLIARFLGCDYLNQGVGGYVFDRKSLKDIHTIPAAGIMVAYGTNDYHMVNIGKLTLEDFRKNVEMYLDELRRIYPCTPIWVISPIWRADCTEDSRKIFLEVCDIVRDCSASRGLFVIDGLSIVGHDERLYVDGIHPNNWGANMMAINALGMLKLPKEGM